ncbi:DUF192 domain-containing protein [Erythrobacter sp. sf7]|uniref:DUF192 domain-containing protein n=1 Tax=Erythrobacter fulvus TaxID=2987523 RepID=A0ABT5JPY4_9SPHN|nr:DUF192 domain-containing protein [Erythrobacter fulvus]MDC8754837.1 DUF192 domain-containing protein [Erythrobacter fulvus]
MVRLWLVAGMAVLAACSPGESATAQAQAPAPAEASGESPRHPVSGLEVIDLVVDRGGKRLPFRVELAASPQAQARGLMFRTELGDNEGMLFPSVVPEPRSFWMKNTPLSLDIIFVGPDGRISNIAADTVPYSLDSVSSDGAASAVLELRAGRAKELGIVPGDRVIYTLP